MNIYDHYVKHILDGKVFMYDPHDNQQQLHLEQNIHDNETVRVGIEIHNNYLSK